MKIDTVISADYIKDEIIKDKIVVVIDMFRATSVITTAMMNNCKNFKLALTVEEAFKIKDSIKDNSIVLGGERHTVRIQGFDLSNSPIEYNKETISGKTVVFTTTNGTRTILGCGCAREIIIGCMLNASAVAKKLIEKNTDVVIVNAGTKGQFSIDDFICGGYIINQLIKDKSSVDLTDISKTALTLYRNYPNVLDIIKEASHYSVMTGLNLQKDIEYCIQKDITDIVPKYQDGKIITE